MDNEIIIDEDLIEMTLIDLITDNAEDTILEGCDIINYQQRGLLTNDKGVVIMLSNGEEIYLTIQGYNFNGQRMN